MHFDNVDFMRRTGTVVYLKAGAEELIKRLAAKRKERPLLLREDWKHFIAELTAEREEAYSEAHASYVVDGQAVEETLEGLTLQLAQVVGH